MRHLQLFESVGDRIGEGWTSDRNVVDAIMETLLVVKGILMM